MSRTLERRGGRAIFGGLVKWDIKHDGDLYLGPCKPEGILNLRGFRICGNFKCEGLLQIESLELDAHAMIYNGKQSYAP